ncbi:MAG: hypothetical protein PUB21_10860 [Bacteroidales bacterium]|nr:hypothetical protein [Bacteroidales bacterium]
METPSFHASGNRFLRSPACYGTESYSECLQTGDSGASSVHSFGANKKARPDSFPAGSLW